MPRSRIKGITIEIGGNATGLDKALKGVNSTINDTQSQLKDVERLLKLDPKNTTLLAQKQKLLAQETQSTKEKLESLKQANEQVSKSVKNYDAWKAKYDPIQEQIDKTKEKLDGLKEEAKNADSELASGKISKEKYDALQAEIINTENDLKDLKQQAKDVDAEFGSPISPKKYDALQREIIETENKLKSLEDGAGKTETALKKVSGALDTVDDGAAVRNLIADLRKAGDAAADTAEATKRISALEVTKQLSDVGDKIQDLAHSALETHASIEGATTRVSAYFNETDEEAERTARVIKSVYEGGVSDSIDSVSNAVLLVKQNLGDLDEVTLTNLTKQALTLEETYGVDMSETLRGVNSLMTQYGMSAQEAMDLVVKGTQNGLDKTNELGDNLSEYAGTFKDAGYSAQDYFQLLNNGLDGGAYNLDKVNDAINEVSTRLEDGSIADGIGQYSEKTQEMFAAWQQGKATQKDVTDSIVADIQRCDNQQQKANMAATAFGTMAEDGSMKAIEALTSVGDTYQDVDGVAQTMFDNTTTDSQEAEAGIRKLQDALEPLGAVLANLATTILPMLASMVSAVVGWFTNLPTPIQEFIAIFGGLMGELIALAPVITALAVSFMALDTALFPIIAIVVAIAAVIAAVIVVIQNWGEITEKVREVFISVVNAIKAKVDEIASCFSELWSSIKNIGSMISSNMSQTWDTIKAAVSNKVQEIASNITEKFNAIKDKASDIFNSVKTAITTPIEKAKNTIKGIIDKIKGFFDNLKLKIPTPSLPKLPKFSLTFGSKTILGKEIKYPTGFDVTWNAEGGIFNNPSIIGVGEAGPEAVLPIEKLNVMFDRMVDSIISGVGTLMRANSGGPSGDVHLDVYLYPNGPKMGEEIVKTYDTYKRRLG